MLQVFYEFDPNVYSEAQTVRYKSWEVGTACAVAEVFSGKIPFDDPAGSLTIKGWRKVRVYETEATPTLLWSGRIRNKVVKRGDAERGSLRTGADRWWDCDAVDQNTLMGARIVRGTSANRPSETAGERLAWLLGTSFTIFVDNGHVTYPSNRLDANDFTGQTAADVISDCAQPGGYNFFALQTDDTGFPELFFMKPESSDWASTVAISDDPADVDGETVFAPDYGHELEISDERVAAGVFLPYSGGDTSSYVYVSDSDIGDEFAYVDRAAPMANVKTSAKATVIAERHLVESSTEDEKIQNVTVRMRPDQANLIRPWHRIPYKSLWMPGFQEYRDCRVVRWSIEQGAHPDGGEGYLVHLELSPVGVANPASCSLAIAAHTSDENSGTEAGGNTASVSSTITEDGYVVAVLCADNGNTPDATGMGTPAGYTAMDARDQGRMTWSIAYKAVSAGTATASATFTRGFANTGAWAAAQVYLPWSSVSVVQESDPSGIGSALPSTPTAGNTILLFALNDRTGTPTVPGTAGPGTGWTRLFHVQSGTVAGDGVANITCWARCVEEGDGQTYDYTPSGSTSLMQPATYVVEIATS